MGVHLSKRVRVQYNLGGMGRSTGSSAADEKPSYIIDPRSLFHTIWDIVMSVLLFSMLVMIPLNFFDEIADALSIFNFSVDAFFLCDCVRTRVRARTHAHMHTRHATPRHATPRNTHIVRT